MTYIYFIGVLFHIQGGSIFNIIFTLNGSIPDYNLHNEEFNPSQGKYGRYNSQPLIQEYYANRNGDKDNILTDITKVMLYYNTSDTNNTEEISEERLDCTGIKNFNE